MAIDPEPHMVVMPKPFLVLRVFQMVFAVFVFGVGCYGASLYGALVPGPVLNLFTGLATIITLIYIFVGTYGHPIIYQYWAILSLEIFCLVFWLISFALLASEVAYAASYECSGGYYDGYYYVAKSCDTSALGLIGLFGACAGVGGVEFVLFVASLSLFSVRLANHRKNGGHCNPDGMAGAAPAAYNQNQIVAPEKVEMQPQTQAYPAGAAPQNGYYPPQGGDARYGTAPAAQPSQQYQQQQMPQPVAQQMAPPQGQYGQ